MAASQPDGLIMCVAGRVAGARTRVLFDSGASHMSKSCAERLGLHMRASSRATKVQIADGKELDIYGTCFAKLQLGSYSAGLTFYVTDITQDWDIVLGQSWMVSHSARLDFGTFSVVGWKNGRQFTLSCQDSSVSDTGPSQQDPKLMSIHQCRRAVRKGCKSFMVNVTSVSESSASLDPAVQAVLDEFADRFPDDLQDLPPVRPVFHTIPLQDPSAPPPFMPLYRLSPLEFEEVDKQVRSLLAKGYMEPSSSPYGAPILFVQKKDGSLRMVFDYRA